MGSNFPRRPVIAFHINFGCYGFWLPNDPRGSNSEYVRSDDLLEFGKATKVEDRRNVARKPHDWKARLEAKKHLKYPPVVLDGKQALAAAHGFAQLIRKNGYVVHACAIMPSPWQEQCGHEFLFTPSDMRRAIDYVERNPMKEGLPPQHWSFVTPYVG